MSVGVQVNKRPEANTLDDSTQDDFPGLLMAGAGHSAELSVRLFIRRGGSLPRAVPPPDPAGTLI